MASQLENEFDALAIVEVSMDKIVLSINVCVDDWTAESAIIASNDTVKTVEWRQRKKAGRTNTRTGNTTYSPVTLEL